MHALLNNAVSGTFIKEHSLRKLSIEGMEAKVLLITMHGSQEIGTKAIDRKMASHFKENEVSLPLPSR